MNGRINALDLAANTDATLFNNTTGKSHVVTVSFCNRGAVAATIRLAHSASASPAAADYLEYGASLPANGVLERTGITVAVGQYLVVQSSAVNVSAVAFGMEI